MSKEDLTNLKTLLDTQLATGFIRESTSSVSPFLRLSVFGSARTVRSSSEISLEHGLFLAPGSHANIVEPGPDLDRGEELHP